jgi:hypothetical protein
MFTTTTNIVVARGCPFENSATGVSSIVVGSV